MKAFGTLREFGVQGNPVENRRESADKTDSIETFNREGDKLHRDQENIEDHKERNPIEELVFVPDPGREFR